MADDLRTINLLIKAAVDQNSSSEATITLRDLRQDLINVKKETAPTAVEFDFLRESIEKVGKNEEIQKLASDLRNAQEQAKLAAKYVEELGKTSNQYGVTGGMIGPAEAPDDGSGGVGSTRLPMSGARGLRYAGMLANQVGGAGAGTGLMMAGELEGVVSVLQQIGPAAIPAAAGLGLLAIGIANYNNIVRESESTLHSAIASLDTYYKAIETGTQETIAAQIKLLQKQAQDADEKVKQLQGGVSSGQGQAAKAGEDIGGYQGAFVGMALYNLTGGAKDLQKGLDDAQASARKAHDDLDALNRAMNDQSVIVRSQIADLDKQASKNADMKRLEEEGNSKQVESREREIQRRREEIATEQEALRALTPTDDTIAKSAALTKENVALYNEYQQLIGVNGPLIQAREEEAAAAKKLNTALQDIVKNNEALAKMDADQAVKEKRQKEDEDRLSQRQMVEDAYKNQIAFAKEQEQIDKVRSAGAQKDQEAVAKENEDAAKIDADYMQKAQKNLQDFNDRESRLTQDHSKQKLRDLQDAQDKLRSLAASGDVAGFVEQQHAINKKLTRDDQDFSEAEQRRHADFIKEQNELEVQRQIRLNELESTFQAERAKRQEAQDQRIKEIEENGKAGNSKSAQLEAELNNIREQWRREDLDRQHTAEEEDFARRRDATVQHGNELVQIVTSQFQQMGAAAQNYLQMSGGSSQPFQMPYIPGLSDFGKVGGDFLDSIFGLQSFDKGGDINQDMIIKAHKGERVLTASENSARQRGGGGPVFNINLDATVGDVATKQFVEQSVDLIIDASVQAYQDAKGKGDF